ncbi:MAG: hypothetical protein MJ126_00855 [Lachnospiraceae bacterium]|nr:hypothetical protein [Lachnospiraceae bacterium]
MEVKTSGLSLAGFIIGIATCVLSLTSMCCGGAIGEIFVTILGIVGIILAAIGRSSMMKTYNSTTTIANLGLVFSIIGTSLAVIIGIVYIILAIFSGGVTLFL